jgi:pyruvate dehydrogenase E2 component (dihydrolipoamide acetyltransferase)
MHGANCKSSAKAKSYCLIALFFYCIILGFCYNYYEILEFIPALRGLRKAGYGMATVMIMPKQGQSVESCIITQWMKNEGDQVTEGEVLFSYETDKASFEEEAKVSGVLLKVLAQEGDDVPCLDNVCIIGEPGEDISHLLGETAESAPAQPEEREAAPSPVAQPTAPMAQEAPAMAPAEAAPISISPRARNTAAKLGVDASLATPSGAEGRVIERDVLALSQSATRAVGGSLDQGTGLGGRKQLSDLEPQVQEVALETLTSAVASMFAPPAYVDKPLSNLRKVIAKAMMNSLQSSAQLTHTVSFDATEILALRAKFKNSDDPDIAGITIGDMVLYAVAKTLPSYEALNANMVNDTTLRVFSNVNLGVAVDTPRGLLVPTIFEADRMSLTQLSMTVKDLASSAKNGNINPDLLQGGSFTVSNLGGYGVENFTPVINYPQTGILGVCTTIDKVRMGKNGLELYKSMPLCLTYDHRAIDGAPATLFLVDLKKKLENFTLLLTK